MTMSPVEDITGWTLEAHFRDRPVGSTPTLLLTRSGVLSDPTNGVATFAIVSSETGTTLGAGDFDYDIWRIDAGSEKRLVWGELSVRDQQWQ